MLRGAAAVGALIVAILLAQGLLMAEVLRTTLDLGYMVEGTPAEATVEIENTGSEPVEITNVRTS